MEGGRESERKGAVWGWGCAECGRKVGQAFLPVRACVAPASLLRRQECLRHLGATHGSIPPPRDLESGKREIRK